MEILTVLNESLLMNVYRLFTAYAMKSVLYDLTSKIYEIVF